MDEVFTQTSLQGWYGSEEEALQQEVGWLQSLPGGPCGYRLRRIILVNYWLYTDTVILEVPHGRLFLSGENASGKSTVLTATLPVAIEGSLRHNRLDTFGDQYKSIEYYVLGSEQSSTPFIYEARTSYIALEFEWCDPEHPPIAPELQERWLNGEKEGARFLTIGLGLYGKIDRKERIATSYFLITDGSRLGENLSLVEERRPIGQSALRHLLKDHGIVCEKQSDYERHVSHYLFGFKEITEFHALIDLLLTLRRPNLSSELKLADVQAYLTDALPAIPIEVTRRVIDTINAIEEMTRRLRQLKTEYEAVREIHQAQQMLFGGLSRNAACEYLEAEQNAKEARASEKRAQRNLEKAEQEEQEKQQQIKEWTEELQQIQGKLQALAMSEGMDRDTRLNAAREQFRSAETLEHQQKQFVEVLQGAIASQQRQAEQQQKDFAATRKSSLANLTTLIQESESKAFWGAAAFQFHISADQLERLGLLDETLPTALEQQLAAFMSFTQGNRLTWLRTLEQQHENRERLEKEAAELTRTESDRRQEFDRALTTFQSQAASFQDVQQKIAQYLQILAQTYPELSLENNPELRTTLIFQMLDQTFDMVDERSIQKALELYQQRFTESVQVIDQVAEALSLIGTEMQQVLKDLTDTQSHIIYVLEQTKELFEQKQQESEFHPPSPARRVLARQTLQAYGVEAYPLYTLIDFADGLSFESTKAGQIENALADAGLLDALVILPSLTATALAILSEEGLSDCLLTLPENDTQLINTQTEEMSESQAKALLYTWLRFDPVCISTLSSAWHELISAILTKLSQLFDSSPEVFSNPSNALRFARWHHGMLQGNAGQGKAEAIGQVTRRTRRQQELVDLSGQILQLEETLADFTSKITVQQKQIQTLQDWQKDLGQQINTSGLQRIMDQMSQSIPLLKNSWSRYRQAREASQLKKQEHLELVKTLEKDCQDVPELARSTKSVREAIDATREVNSTLSIIRSEYRMMISNHTKYHEILQTLSRLQDDYAKGKKNYQETQNQVIQAKSALQQLEQEKQEGETESPEKRRKELLKQKERLEADIAQATGELGRYQERVQQYTDKARDASIAVVQQEELVKKKQQALLNALTLYPLPLTEPALPQFVPENASIVAQQLLTDLPIGESFPLWKERLDKECQNAQNNLNDIYYKHQAALYAYGPQKISSNNLVTFQHEENNTPAKMLCQLEEWVQMRETLLEQEERKLFEDFLLQNMAKEISNHILRAEDWVQQLNERLQEMTLVGDGYDLAWVALSAPDPARLGGHLACYTHLLRKSTQMLTSEERELLQQAFQQEIQKLRHIQSNDNNNVNTHFEENLRQIFDYRAWFYFAISITPQGGKRMLLDNKVLGGRSGAERLFALYVPLFAALSLLYESAAPGAPRLLALDEAFDKASINNMQRTIEFLAEQQFQWIMTGPQINLSGTRVPISIRYLMLHEKGSKLATVVSSRTWQSSNQWC